MKSTTGIHSAKQRKSCGVATIILIVLGNGTSNFIHHEIQTQIFLSLAFCQQNFQVGVKFMTSDDLSNDERELRRIKQSCENQEEMIAVIGRTLANIQETLEEIRRNMDD